MEYKIIKALHNKEIFSEAGVDLRDYFGPDLKPLYDTLCECHQKFEGDLDVDVVAEIHLAQSENSLRAKDLFRKIISEIQGVKTPSKEITLELLTLLQRKYLARKIAGVAVDIINDGEDRFQEISTIIENTPALSNEKFVESSSDLANNLKLAAPENRFLFRVPSLCNEISGAGRGNSITIFGRPEVGKSSLMAQVAVGFAADGHSVSYLGNEEPIHNIMLNFARSYLQKTEEELRGVSEEELARWNSVRENIHAYDAVGWSLADVGKLCNYNSTDIVIVDQTDKLAVNKKLDGVERYREIYTGTREIAKRNDVLMINVTQASADAEGRRYLSYDMMAGSKTDKAAEVDLIIGIGKNPSMAGDDDGFRHLTVSKNKINGWHGFVTVGLQAERCLYVA